MVPQQHNNHENTHSEKCQANQNRTVREIIRLIANRWNLR